MRDFQAIQSQTYDLIVIGGGINGAAVARDAALRGLKPILIEKGDFSGATSSWSTRLIHGGLRYLEYFEFALVRESLKEREILLRTAPHLVKPLMLTVPVYAGRSRPFWKIRAGMMLYDIFSFDKTLPAHRIWLVRNFGNYSGTWTRKTWSVVLNIMMLRRFMRSGFAWKIFSLPRLPAR
jgi:glycerol-3-phosphate dehydrogenase